MNNVDDSSNEVCASKIISEDIYSALRDSQKTSLDVSFDYLSQKNNNKSCLISLPTGGGKTGVICLLSHYSRQQKILVLCHRKAVKNQLIKQLSGGFFEKIDVKPTDELKVVNSDILDTTEDGIYVTTFQKLRLMTKEQMTVLRSDIDLVIVDEGHSEPSPEWSKLTRGLDAYKVVVTATPYRNDLFQFDISHEYSYFYSFKDAVAANDIEKPVFESIKKIELKSVIKNYLKINSGSKCIVKCDRRTDVEAYYELLNDDFRVLAVHDSFTNDERTNVKVDVPKNLDESDFDIIIHQRKLDEGVDIPQAKLLILTYAVGSGRELVQTVGRVVRKFNGLPAEVKEIESDKNNRVWDNYLKFDKYLSNKSAADKFFKALDLSSLLKSYTDSFPDMSYLGNRYAAKLDLNSEKLIDAIEIPLLSVVFKNKKSNFDFQDMMETLIWRSVREGEYVKELPLTEMCGNDNLKGFVSVSFNSSKYLKDMFFFEPKINVFIAKEFENSVGVFDSKGRKFIKEKGLEFSGSVSITDLLSLAGETGAVRTKEASTSSINKANRRPDTISMKGRNLENMAIPQSNSSYKISTIKVANIDEDDNVKSSYYLGAMSGRITDQKNGSLSIKDFSDWIDGVYQKICDENVTNSRLLKSYSVPVNEAPKDNVASIIFDFSDDESSIEIEVLGERYQLPNDFVYLEFNGKDLLVSELSELELEVTYDAEEKDILIIPSYDGKVLLDGEYVDSTLSEFLNKRIEKVLYDDGLCYSGSNFYQLNLPMQGGFEEGESDLDDIFIGVKELSGKSLKEKWEGKVSADEFYKNSIFYLFDMLKNITEADPSKNSLGPFYDYIPNLDFLLCTDMGPEQADFIISSKSKLVFVHIKCGKTKKPESSAGALFEVGSQALKNMEHMISLNKQLKASNSGYMVKSWPSGNAKNRLNERVRLLNGKRFINVENNPELRKKAYEDAWDVVIERRSSPRVEKEIWVVAGNSFSKSDFFTQLNLGNKGRATSLQAYQLIQSWNATASSEDIGIKFFVSK